MPEPNEFYTGPAGLFDIDDADDISDIQVSSPMPVPSEGGMAIDIDGDNEPDVIFMLDPIPGAPDAGEIVIEDDDADIEVKDESEIEVNDDPWNWSGKGLGNFIDWLQNMFADVPKHSGYDSTGLEKAISYFENLDKEITKAMRQDYKNEIDSAKAERAREQIENALERLIERLDRVRSDKFKRHKKKNDKKKKSSLTEFMMIKNASRGEKVSGIVITVPLLISRIARVCINGMISGGHDIEEMFEKQAKEYSLDKRERAELAQLLDDMGYYMHVDRGYPPGEHVDTTRSDNFDWGANYQG
jgi:hypothetical protein